MNESIKSKLHEYIETADDKKLDALYTLLEHDIDDRSGLYTEADIAGFEATSDACKRGEMKTYTIEESMARMRQALKSRGNAG